MKKVKVVYSLENLQWTIQTPVIYKVGEREDIVWKNFVYIDNLELFKIILPDIQEAIKAYEKRR